MENKINVNEIIVQMINIGINTISAIAKNIKHKLDKNLFIDVINYEEFENLKYKEIIYCSSNIIKYCKSIEIFSLEDFDRFTYNRRNYLTFSFELINKLKKDILIKIENNSFLLKANENKKMYVIYKCDNIGLFDNELRVFKLEIKYKYLNKNKNYTIFKEISYRRNDIFEYNNDWLKIQSKK